MTRHVATSFDGIGHDDQGHSLSSQHPDVATGDNGQNSWSCLSAPQLASQVNLATRIKVLPRDSP